jgi:hypothetical protein
MKLKDSVFADASPIHGTGLFAAVPIAKGGYIGTYEGPEAKRDGKYVLWVHEEGRAPVGRRGMNLLRYLNHSDDPNAEFDGFDLYAIRPIQPDEEVTIDYEGARGP